VVYGTKEYGRSERTLAYELAANYITYGEDDKAAEVLAGIIKKEKPRSIKERNKLLGQFKSSMKSKSPLGPIAEENINQYISTLPPEERGKVYSYHKIWIKRYENAIKKSTRL
jgi:hypothetical protein